MKIQSLLTALGLLFFLSTELTAQSVSVFNQHQAFNPDLFSSQSSTYRSASGVPAANYWQNKADYKLAVKLDTIAHTVSGTTSLTYINNSPDQLNFLWLELGQNLFKEGSIGGYAQGAAPDAGGFQFFSVKIKAGNKLVNANYLVNDTRMQIRLDKPVEAKGGKIELEFAYSFKISDTQFRTSRVATKNGELYDVAQWYPRMCVYDDLRGWNTLPYLGAGEFYCEYGNFEYEVTVPWDLIVVGSGELLNPEEVLTSKQISRLEKAKKSDHTQFIISPKEVATTGSRPVTDGWLTWKFEMKNSRDVAWAASKAYVWDAAKVNLPNEKTALAMSVYPVESVGDTAWTRSTEYLKHSIEHFSERWFEYPYPVALNIAGPVGGMEYPGLCFCGWKIKKAKVMYFVTAHEIGHNWFPMIVGSDERRHAFMDEGFNTFVDIYAQDDFNAGEFAPKRDGEYDPEGKNPARDLVAYLVRDDAEGLINFADVFQQKDSHTLNYYKSALGLVLAREYILGAERFDYAFREYIRNWAFKHPSPTDFFRSMNNATGEDLNWFWNAWYCQTWRLDQGVDGVTYVDDDPVKGAKITLVNNQQMVMPVQLKIIEKNGTVTEERLPVEIWQKGGKYIFSYPSTSAIDSVIVDPYLELPDINSENDRWGSSN